MKRRLLLTLSVLLASCSPGQADKKPLEVDLLAPQWIGKWSKPDIPGAGRVIVGDHTVTLGMGAPMTVWRFDAWKEAGLPLIGYTVTMEARRVSGTDFFSALTFPVGTEQRCLSLINGGWGGKTTGLSNIDNMTASENSTTSAQPYENEKWHQFRLTVTPKEIKVWLDDRIIINQGVEGHQLAVRPGDIEQCMPFGLASYNTRGEVRKLQVQVLEE